MYATCMHDSMHLFVCIYVYRETCMSHVYMYVCTSLYIPTCECMYMTSYYVMFDYFFRFKNYSIHNLIILRGTALCDACIFLLLSRILLVVKK